MDYFAIRKALETGEGYVGTVEFFPEEGKYHLDGHRKCGVKLSPRDTDAHGGRCPACGGALTIGVSHRVEALADRAEEEAVPPATAGEVSNLVPLPEVLSEITASGPASRTVERGYGRLLSALGPELSILQSVPLEDIARADSALLAEGIARLRAGKVTRDAGYDGEYGVIRLFADDELCSRTAGGPLFELPPVPRLVERERRSGGLAQASMATAPSMPQSRSAPSLLVGEGRGGEPAESVARDANYASQKPGIGSLAGLDDDQRAAASIVEGPLVIVAGPGSGKTRTLVHRILHLVTECNVAHESCLAITFTRRAAAEMKERLRERLGAAGSKVAIHTFHSLALAMLREHTEAAGLERGFRIADEPERAAALAAVLGVPRPRAEKLIRAIAKSERTGPTPSSEVAEARAAYRTMLAANNWVDFEDLVYLAERLIANNAEVARLYRDRFHFVSVDEFQDVDQRQYRLISRLALPPGGNLCIIGDPHQAIYGFRGADAGCFERFRSDYPGAASVELKRNYRSSGTIVAASAQVIAAPPGEPIAAMVRGMNERITLHAAPSERAEADFVVATIEQAIGGASFFSIDSGRAGGREAKLSFADFAVLYRTEAQAAPLCEAFARSGIPFRKLSHGPLSREPEVRALLDALTMSAPEGDIAARLRKGAERLTIETGESSASGLALQRLLTLAASCRNDEALFRDAVALARNVDFWDARAEGVALLTLHAAKGLEFACVFIVGLEDGVLPLHWGRGDDAEAEELSEERRLFYVGMTRAKDRLVLTRALKRLWRGRVCAQPPSPFLADIESELIRQQHAKLPRKHEHLQMKLL
jgi:superfamily I DNA/RNA helicase